MKRLTLLFPMICMCIAARSQTMPTHQVARDKFFFGLNYSYLNANMKLLSLTKHSVWAGEDLGTKDLTGDDIDTINSYMDYKEKLNDVHLGIGMVFLNKPGGNWYIDGQVLLGFLNRNNELIDTDNDSADIKVITKHWSPSFGLDFNFKYLFNDKWALNLGLNSLFTYGKISEIDEFIFPVVQFMDEDRENSFRTSYSYMDLMASYKIKKVTVAVGPGFYYMQSWNNYKIVRTDREDGTEYEDSIETTLRTDMFINGCIRIDWRVAPHFLITAGGGFSKDILANAGLIYFL